MTDYTMIWSIAIWLMGGFIGGCLQSLIFQYQWKKEFGDMKGYGWGIDAVGITLFTLCGPISVIWSIAMTIREWFKNANSNRN